MRGRLRRENNIPVVGKEQVLRGREMQWLRIDRYYEGDPTAPDIYYQPVPCMQCENAPCEVVCPVAATVHSDEGLNDMVYNRCVGTRYCSNNCPYKVRRFNFLLYSDWTTPTLKMARNPDVTVRSRGVMEKCTYCVQRINHARIEAKLEDRVIRDGEVHDRVPGRLPDAGDHVRQHQRPESRGREAEEGAAQLRLLGDLNTRPRTTYLAAVRNPNPELHAGGREPRAEHSECARRRARPRTRALDGASESTCWNCETADVPVDRPGPRARARPSRPSRTRSAGSS